MTFLFIDDDRNFLEDVKRLLKGDNVVVAECHSVEQALQAIESTKPNVLFLDHNLTRDGGEGIVIADIILKENPEIRIYSTTNSDTTPEYEKRGIGVIKQLNFWDSVKSIINKG